jgi:prevent-host-death family protein
MVSVTLDEAQNRLAELVKVVEEGETVIITRNNLPVATLAPAALETRRPRFGSAKGAVIWISNDFDAPLDDFREYME